MLVITYNHKQETFVVHTKVEDYEEEKFYFHKIPEGFPFVDLQEYEDSVPMVNNVRKNYKFFTRAEIERSDAVYKTFGNLVTQRWTTLRKFYVPTISKTVQ